MLVKREWDHCSVQGNLESQQVLSLTLQNNQSEEQTKQWQQDILMNILYKETMVVEMQLAIKQQKSRLAGHQAAEVQVHRVLQQV